MFETILTYKGRITRSEYFITGNILLIIFLFYMFLSFPLYLLFLCADSVISSFLIIKRCHDLNKSGWYGLLFLVPFANIWWFFCLLLNDGTIGPNKYGEDPKGRICNDKKSKKDR